MADLRRTRCAAARRRRPGERRAQHDGGGHVEQPHAGHGGEHQGEPPDDERVGEDLAGGVRKRATDGSIGTSAAA